MGFQYVHCATTEIPEFAQIEKYCDPHLSSLSILEGIVVKKSYLMKQQSHKCVGGRILNDLFCGYMRGIGIGSRKKRNWEKRLIVEGVGWMKELEEEKVPKF